MIFTIHFKLVYFVSHPAVCPSCTRSATEVVSTRCHIYVHFSLTYLLSYIWTAKRMRFIQQQQCRPHDSHSVQDDRRKIRLFSTICKFPSC